MKQRTLYQVRVTQEIPFCDYDEDGEETKVSSGRIEEYVAGRFSAEHNAKTLCGSIGKQDCRGKRLCDKLLYAESLNYKNNPNGRVGGLIEKGVRALI